MDKCGQLSTLPPSFTPKILKWKLGIKETIKRYLLGEYIVFQVSQIIYLALSKSKITFEIGFSTGDLASLKYFFS